MAERRHLLELGKRVQGPEFGGMRHVHHAGHHHVVAVKVVFPRRDCGRYVSHSHLAVFLRHGDHLVARILDGTRLVQAHMPAFRRDNSLVRGEQRIDHHGVHLRAAQEEMDLGVAKAT